MHTFYVEHTDTYAGEANYCWVNRFKVHAKSARHAITKVKRELWFTAPHRAIAHTIMEICSGPILSVHLSVCSCSNGTNTAISTAHAKLPDRVQSASAVTARYWAGIR